MAGHVTTTVSSGSAKRVGTPAGTTYATTSGTSRTLSTPAVTRDAAALQAARGTLTKNLTAPKAEEKSPLEGLHKVLDGVGYIPAVGDLADLINSVIYAVEGDWSDAVISAAAMFIDGATAGRLARNSMEIAGEAVEAVTKRAVKNSSGKFVGEATGDIGQDIAEEIWDQISEEIEENDSDSESEKRIYKPSPKHDPISGWGSPDPIPDIETGQALLDTAYSSTKNKQLYNIYNNQLIKFQPDRGNEWHAYLVENPAKEVPADVLRKMLQDNKITKVQYKDFIKNN